MLEKIIKSNIKPFFNIENQQINTCQIPICKFISSQPAKFIQSSIVSVWEKYSSNI